MVTQVHQVTQHIMKLSPERNLARLAFYHFLLSVPPAQGEFKKEVVESFYHHALCFDFWQNHIADLGKTIVADLESFYRWNRMESPDWLTQMGTPDHFQWITLEKSHDLQEVVRRHCVRPNKKDQLKIVPIENQNVLAITVLEEGGVQVLMFGPRLLIQNGELKPMGPLAKLIYTSRLELLPATHFWVQGPHQVRFFFHSDQDRVTGVALRGHTFQKLESFSDLPISQNLDLFAATKSLERYFVNRETDPFYCEIVNMLEKANEIISQGKGASRPQLESALQKGQWALKMIFPQDRLLSLLVTHLSLGLKGSYANKTEQIHSGLRDRE